MQKKEGLARGGRGSAVHLQVTAARGFEHASMWGGTPCGVVRRAAIDDDDLLGAGLRVDGAQRALDAIRLVQRRNDDGEGLWGFASFARHSLVRRRIG